MAANIVLGVAMAPGLQPCLVFGFFIAVPANEGFVAFAQAHAEKRIVANVNLVQIPVTIFDD